MADPEIQFPLNHPLIEEATRLVEERKVLADRLAKIDATRPTVSEAVYERVRTDYTRQIEAARAALLAKKEEIDRELATLREARQRIEVNLAAQKDTVEELRLRHSLGELPDAPFREQSIGVEEKLRKFEKVLAAVGANIQRYEGVFAGETDLTEPPRGSPATTVRPRAEVPMTTVLRTQEEESATDEEEYQLAEEGEGYFDGGSPPASGAPAPSTTVVRQVGDTEVPVARGATLTVIRGTNRGQAFPMAPETTIGRASSNTITLKEAKVSRQHACIRRQGTAYAIHDLQSSNGLFVNGERVTAERILTDGDEIQVGDFVLKFRP